MNKVIVSFANNASFVEMLSIALPSFYRYASEHSYDVFIPSEKHVQSICSSYGWDHNRPTSWLKVAILKYALEKYDTALWIDSDVIINKFDKDIAEDFTDQFMQGFVVHKDIYEGLIPNCGVWLLNKNSIDYLSTIWNQTDFINHKWWEQGANIMLMMENKQYIDQSFILPYEFNVHKNDMRFDENSYLQTGRFLHATTWNDRIGKMKEWAHYHA